MLPRWLVTARETSDVRGKGREYQGGFQTRSQTSSHRDRGPGLILPAFLEQQATLTHTARLALIIF